VDANREKQEQERNLAVQQVKEKSQELVNNSKKRNLEQIKLEKEKAEIEKKQNEIDELEKRLHSKQIILQEKEADLNRHRIFSTFLTSVVEDKSGDKEGFSSISDLQNRFKSLKNENKQLMQRVSYTLVTDSFIESQD